MYKKDYKNRIVDGLLDLKLESFGATLIKGADWRETPPF